MLRKAAKARERDDEREFVRVTLEARESLMTYKDRCNFIQSPARGEAEREIRQTWRGMTEAEKREWKESRGKNFFKPPSDYPKGPKRGGGGRGGGMGGGGGGMGGASAVAAC